MDKSGSNKMRKIYLANMYSKRLETAEYAEQLTKVGHMVTAQWLTGKEETQPKRENAIMDFDDVKRCDLLICFTQPYGSKNKGGGRHTELGLALAWGIETWIVGEREQIFHWHPEVKQFDSWFEAVDELDFQSILEEITVK